MSGCKEGEGGVRGWRKTPKQMTNYLSKQTANQSIQSEIDPQ